MRALRAPVTARYREPMTQERSDEISYETARAELAEIVTKLESGGGTLEEALALWERGERLAAICQERLDNARARLDSATEARAQTT